MLYALELDDLEYVKGILCAQHNDYFKVLAENYCYKNGLPIEMAYKIAWEFDNQEVKDEDKGLVDYDIKLNWMRDDFNKVKKKIPEVNHGRGYDLTPQNNGNEFRKRLVLKFPKKIGQAYCQKYNNVMKNNKPEIYTILPETSLGAFIGYKNIKLTQPQLQEIIKNKATEWKAALSNVKGVYVITDVKTGKLYIGAAYGKDGIWGRWKGYANVKNLTNPKEDINLNRKHPIDTDGIFMGMDYARVNYKNLCKKLKDITKNMQEENFPEQSEKTNFYRELLIENYDIEKTDIPSICTKRIKSFKMWHGTNYEPDGLQDLKECFANYYKNR